MANKIFKFSEIEKIDIINTNGMTPQQVYEKYKPDAFMNLALYDMASKENITYLKDENKQSGYLFSREGIGIKSDNQVIWCSKDTAYKDASIRDYVSGSPVVVKNGVKVKEWGNKYSSYVDGSHLRSALGFNKDGLILIATDTEITLDKLADDAIKYCNADYMINCDGGGSCHLQVGEEVIRKSGRANVSWVLIYLKKKEEGDPMSKHTVIIDIGHHENDSGAVSGTLREVDLNVSISKHLIADLEHHGVNVVVTTGTLADRVKKEHEVNPSYFVSIHNNSSKDHKGDGTEVLVYKNVYPIRTLAENILAEVVGQGLNNSRGIKERTDLYVLAKTICPAIIVECAFIDSKDVEAIDEEHERKAFGEAIAKGILKTLKIDYMANTKDTYYRVSVGSYKDKTNAEKILNEAKEKGFKDTFITAVEV